MRWWAWWRSGQAEAGEGGCGPSPRRQRHGERGALAQSGPEVEADRHGSEGAPLVSGLLSGLLSGFLSDLRFSLGSPGRPDVSGVWSGLRNRLVRARPATGQAPFARLRATQSAPAPWQSDGRLCRAGSSLIRLFRSYRHGVGYSTWMRHSRQGASSRLTQSLTRHDGGRRLLTRSSGGR